MRLSPETITLLKNAIGINNAIIIKAAPDGTTGTEVKVLHPQGTMQAVFTIAETLKKDVYLFDTGAFLNTLIGFGEHADVEFGDSEVKITKPKSLSRYLYAYPEQILWEARTLTLPQVDVTFTLEAEDLNEILKYADINHLTEIKLYSENGILKMQAVNKGNSASYFYAHDVGQGSLAEPIFFKRDFFKFIPGTYKVEACERMIRFTHASIPMSYMVGSEI